MCYIYFASSAWRIASFTSTAICASAFSLSPDDFANNAFASSNPFLANAESRSSSLIASATVTLQVESALTTANPPEIKYLRVRKIQERKTKINEMLNRT